MTSGVVKTRKVKASVFEDQRYREVNVCAFSVSSVVLVTHKQNACVIVFSYQDKGNPQYQTILLLIASQYTFNTLIFSNISQL